jgi:hypothetical protein
MAQSPVNLMLLSTLNSNYLSIKERRFVERIARLTNPKMEAHKTLLTNPKTLHSFYVHTPANSELS